MVWLTWRQHRAQVLVTAGLLAALGLFLLVRGQSAATVLGWLPAVPMAIGMFWGVPVLAREIERGTQRLAWTQSVPRRHWLVTKLGGLGLAVTVAGLGVGLMVSAWVKEFDGDRFGDAALFSGTGVVVGAWWLFAFVLGTATGAVVRRVLPAVAVTVGLFLVVLFGVFQAREAYAVPVRTAPDAEAPAGSSVVGATFVSRSGADVAEPPECASASDERYLRCVDGAGYRSVLFFQPADRYWRYQWTETAILVLGAAVLAAPVAHRVLRRPV